MRQHALVRAGDVVHQGEALIAAQIQPGQHGAVGPAVDHLAPVGVGGLGVVGDRAVQILQCAGLGLKALGVLQQEDVGLAAGRQLGAQPGDAGHLVVGVGVLVRGVKVNGVAVHLHNDLAVAVQVGAERRQRVLQRGDGVGGQVAGADISDLHVGARLKNGVLDDPHAEHDDQHGHDHGHPVIVPPVGGFFFFCIFARGFRRLIVSFGTVLCDPSHSAGTLLLSYFFYYNTNRQENL